MILNLHLTLHLTSLLDLLSFSYSLTNFISYTTHSHYLLHTYLPYYLTTHYSLLTQHYSPPPTTTHTYHF
ncbi:conserved hypothetical protein [Bacillus sp. 349Y]|nr:conserved hypothetical protein [Bacillus sp. 349Y]